MNVKYVKVVAIIIYNYFICFLIPLSSWSEYAAGIPHCIKTENALSLPPEVQFSFTKKSEFFLTSAFGYLLLVFTAKLIFHLKKKSFFSFLKTK